MRIQRKNRRDYCFGLYDISTSNFAEIYILLKQPSGSVTESLNLKITKVRIHYVDQPKNDPLYLGTYSKLAIPKATSLCLWTVPALGWPREEPKSQRAKTTQQKPEAAIAMAPLIFHMTARTQ